MTSNKLAGANYLFSAGGETAAGLTEANVHLVDLNNPTVSKQSGNGMKEFLIAFFNN